ncbi:kinase-like domain-containing protein [Gigaspora rosea]|uniref:Kinase-like domain-containing protein n=1 Tax=Gigaspora rosea TaxID=44941 RepID=A0A397U5N0_9GLOM|nr:kinase-like domain-containing protein [Gigaspora rosea]
MPYIAPEVLLGQKYSPAADIYSFGVIMAEMTTGIRPFYERSFDTKLAIEISCGKRPEFALRTPNCYIELAKSCMHFDSQKRPTAETIYNKLSEWHNFVKESDEPDDLDEFLSITLRKHPDIVYASMFINTHDIAQYYKEISDQFNIKDEIASASNNFEISIDAINQ